MVNLEVISCLDVPSLGGTFCDILSFDEKVVFFKHNIHINIYLSGITTKYF